MSDHASTHQQVGENTAHDAGVEPQAAPAARWVAVLLGLALIALGGLAGQFVFLRAKEGSAKDSVVAHFTQWVGTLTWQEWMLYAAPVAAAVGILLLVLVFKPRAKPYRALVAPSSNVWMRPVDIARMTSAAAKALPGVTDAETTVTRRSVRVDVTADEGTDEAVLTQRVAEATGPLVTQVARPLELLVRVTTPKEETYE